MRARDYIGFTRSGPSGTTENDGVVRRAQLDVQMMLEVMASMGLPSMDSMSAVDARNFSNMMAAVRAPGPEVGEIVERLDAGLAERDQHRFGQVRHGGKVVLDAQLAAGGAIGFLAALERFRPQAAYDFSRPPHPGTLNYEAWQWPMSGADVCAAFRTFQGARSVGDAA